MTVQAEVHPIPSHLATQAGVTSDSAPSIQAESSSQPAKGVTFAAGLHAPSAHGIPEGWFPLGNGSMLGEQEGSVVSRDGVLYTADTVEVDLSVPDRPLWRFRRATGTQQGVEKGRIPVRRTFRGLLDFLAAQPMSASE